MRKICVLFSLAFLFSLAVQAQPFNDDCSGLIDLGVAPACPPDTFSNVGATPSDIGFDNNPPCFNTGVALRDVWFAFTCPTDMLSFRITLTGVTANSIQNPELAIYRGDCEFDGLALFACVKANLGDNSLFIDLTGLTPNAQYFLRVSDYSVSGSPNSGNFTLCVDEIPPIVTIDQGSSTLCSGTLYDTGGPDDPYGPNENFTFTICPDAPTACITLTFEYFNIENSTFGAGGDVLTFFNGANTAAPVIGQINGGGFNQPIGGGSVCYQVRSTGPCMTIQFQSDGAVQLDGFKATWECSAEPCPTGPVPISITNNPAPTLIADIVASPATTVSVVSVNCASGAYGVFSYPTDNNDLGLKSGLVLTSGQTIFVPGPNNQGGAGVNNGFPGDPELDILSQQQGNGQLSFDACIVELDVFAATNELTFEYIFGSEEYPEYVNSNFNDIFAFLISGPGIVGQPGLGAKQNIALLPGSNTPVQINSVNHLANWEYYRNNQTIGLQPYNAQGLQYDGLTSDFLGKKKSLTARAQVIPCNTYRLKLAVADRGDGVFDSGVFVSEILGGTPELTLSFANGLEYLIEDCAVEEQVIIKLPEPLSDTVSYNIVVGGTATPGDDYLLNLPQTITFLPGETIFSFPLTVLSDGIIEGNETITVQLTNNFGCGTVVYVTLEIQITDNVTVDILGGDTLFVCPGATLQLQAVGATDYFWQPPGAVSNPFVANPTITPTEDVALRVIGSVGICVDTATAFVRIIDPMVTLSADDTEICLGESVQLTAVDNVGGSGLTWSPVTGLDDPGSLTPIATPTVTTTYTVSVETGGCIASAQVTIEVDTLFLPGFYVPDTIVCQKNRVLLAEILPPNSNTYVWMPATDLDDPNVSGAIAIPNATTVYTLTVTSANGYCSQTLESSINVISADIEAGDNYREICLGDTLLINAALTPAGGSPPVWTPNFGISATTGPDVQLYPGETVTYQVRYEVNGCLARDSILVRVDSLPALLIERFPDKSVYCPGDTIYLLSPIYEPADFPSISHGWFPAAGQLTPLDNWNMVVIATVSQNYIRETFNRACFDTSSVFVNVGEIVDLIVSAEPTQICAGETVQLNVKVSPPHYAIEWEGPALSCTDCLNPVATPTSSALYIVMPKDADCPSAAAVSVTVALPPDLSGVIAQADLCLGQSVTLNTIEESDVTYSWTSQPPGFVSDEARPAVTPSVNTTYFIQAQNALCAAADTAVVNVFQAAIDAGDDVSVCVGTVVPLSAVATGSPGTVTWNSGSLSGPNTSVTVMQSGFYTATLNYGPGCVAADSILVIALFPPQIVSLEGDPEPLEEICEGAQITLKLGYSPNTGVQISWYENGVLIQGAALDSLVIRPSARAGEQASFYAVATNADGCSTQSDSLVYTARRCFAIPNAFTPGNGGVNDTFDFVTYGGEVSVESFVIYNRWGQKVFEAQNNADRWNGTQNGKPSPSDVYIYVIEVRFPNNETASYKGEVLLLR